ncbi:LOW QUALITY PROTEIN: hypothetical protein PoB_001747800 [Plakobranchus ocellatus]|uniref:Uncharacterized protein n=1 Tax=Plakobranchus ocellatus TaxID=259542 RepID=A0AAV3Z8J6_9GAST|nr:LOW QUALITY PROTEIN: hypothetical protein PoB_001747800 [Plakobranchus ocellatus]
MYGQYHYENLAPEDCTYAWNIFTRPYQGDSPRPRKVDWRQLRRPQQSTLFDPDYNNVHRSSQNSQYYSMETRDSNRKNQRKPNLSRFMTAKVKVDYNNVHRSSQNSRYYSMETRDSNRKSQSTQRKPNLSRFMTAKVERRSYKAFHEELMNRRRLESRNYQRRF